MAATLTPKQKTLIGIIKGGYLRERKGYKYYLVPTTLRRSGEMRVRQSEIDKLKKLNLI